MKGKSAEIVIGANYLDNSGPGHHIKRDQPRLWPMFLMQKIITMLFLPPAAPTFGRMGLALVAAPTGFRAGLSN